MTDFENPTSSGALQAIGGSRRRPLISVVIPCYNGARFLGEAIDSALAQSWKPVEIIVVNDGSTDNTASVLAAYPNIIVLTQTNQGRSAARNAGLRASRGEYVTFLDADDLLLPKALEIGIGELAGRPEYAFASGAYQWIDEDGRPVGGPCLPAVFGDRHRAWVDNDIVIGTVLHRRSILESVGGFDPLLHAAEDWDLYLRIARQFSFRQHLAAVACYRKHQTNTSNDYRLMSEMALKVLEHHRKYIFRNREHRARWNASKRYFLEPYCRAVLRESADRLSHHGERLVGLRDLVVVLSRAPWRCVRIGAEHLIGGPGLRSSRRFARQPDEKL